MTDWVARDKKLQQQINGKTSKPKSKTTGPKPKKWAPIKNGDMNRVRQTKPSTSTPVTRATYNVPKPATAKRTGGKKLAPTMAPAEMAIQSVIDMMQMKPPKLVDENEVYRNLTRMYGEAEADEKMRAYVASYPNKLNKTGWGRGPGKTEFEGF